MGGGSRKAKPRPQTCILRRPCYPSQMHPGLRLSAFGGFILLGACEVRTADEANKAEAPTVLPTLPVADAPLMRADLLLAVVQVGSAAASDRDDAAAQGQLDGKRFELRLRFGCPGTAIADAPRTAKFDPQGRTVKMSFPTEIDLGSPIFANLVEQDIEAVEGFWIRRPWLLEPACPAAVAEPPLTAASSSEPAPSPSPPAEPAQQPRIGIAQFFTQSAARTHRREQRAYQATEGLLTGESPSRTGYNLVIEGRLLASPTGKVITCIPATDRAPTCVISARFDQVSVERADTGKMVAEWPSG